VRTLDKGAYDATVVAVAHREFRELGAQGVRKLGKKNHVMYDIKHVFRSDETDGRL
jgi:UDP-N-acetyl-D-galactosamine dehydrogenase